MTQLILSIAKSIGVNAYLLLSVCTVESNLRNINNHNDGKEGHTSYGVCQVQERTAKEIESNVTFEDLQKPKVNIRIAAKYLKKQIKRYDNNLVLGIAAYNSGTVKFNKRGELINRKYVEKVLKQYTKYEVKK